jgi:hypothetical protein
MKAEEQSRQWYQKSEPIFAHIAQWREEHPQATMAEIEQAVDEQMQSLRAQVLQEAAQSRSEEDLSSSPHQRACCPDCQVPMQARGQRERRLQTTGGQWVTLQRTYLACPRCGYGFFPPG